MTNVKMKTLKNAFEIVVNALILYYCIVIECFDGKEEILGTVLACSKLESHTNQYIHYGRVCRERL